jgi:hypothetical protein
MTLKSSAGLLLAFVAFAALSACGQRATASSAGELIHDTTHGLTVKLPPGWQRPTASLTPHLEDPREVLSAGTFPLRYRQTGCAHLPSPFAWIVSLTNPSSTK